MSTDRDRDRGQPTHAAPHRRGAPAGADTGLATVTILIIGLIAVLMAGALLGAGTVFAARAHGYDLAQSAARAGAQRLDTGALRLDPAAAAQAARRHLAAAGATGTVDVTALRITVTATSRQDTPMLAPFGVPHVTVTATASATPTTGPAT